MEKNISRMTCAHTVDLTKSQWYLLHCQTNKEFFVAQLLHHRLGVEGYIPECQIRSLGKSKRVALFPGYLFIRTNLEHVALSEINASPGVIKLVAFGDEPCAVPQEVITHLRERLARYDQSPIGFFQQGDHVRVRHEGPLQGLDLIFVGPATSGQRVYVLLSLLGRITKIQVDENRLEKQEKIKRARLTRGKGRRINRDQRILLTV